MTTTSHLGITLVDQSQSQKEVTMNAALVRLDALLNNGAKSKTVATPPGSPASGDLYIVAASPTGAWTGQAGNLAYFDQVWRFIAPLEGMTLWVNDADALYTYNGTSWVASTSGGGSGSVTLTGDVAGSGTGTVATTIATNAVTTGKINNSAVTYAKMQNMSAATLLGNPGGSASAPSEVSLPLSVANGGTGGSTAPYDIVIYWPGTAPGGAATPIFYMTMDRSVTLPASLTGSSFSSTIAATASTVFTLYKNGTSIGTVTFTASGTTGTISFASAVSFTAGDVFSILNQSTPDSTLANLYFTIKGTRSN